MRYLVQEWKSGKVVNQYEGVEADSPREAIESSGANTEMQTTRTGDISDWKYSDDADGAGSFSDPENTEHFVEALPQVDE